MGAKPILFWYIRLPQPVWDKRLVVCNFFQSLLQAEVEKWAGRVGWLTSQNMFLIRVETSQVGLD